MNTYVNKAAGLMDSAREPSSKITHLSNLTGAATRALYDELNDWWNIKWFAKGDGVTDDAAAIDAMFSQVPDGSVVYFPRGTYLTSTGRHTIQNKTRVHIVGHYTEIKYTGSSATDPVFYLNSSRQCVIEGFHFTTRTAGKSVSICIRRPSDLIGNSSDQGEIRNCWMDSPNIGVQIGAAGEGQTSSWTLMNVIVVSAASAGFRQDGAATEVIHYLNCYATSCVIGFDLKSTSATMTQCVTGGFDCLIHLNVTGGMRNLVLINPHFELKNAAGKLFVTAGTNYITVQGGSLSNFAVASGGDIADCQSAGFLRFFGTSVYHDAPTLGGAVFWKIASTGLKFRREAYDPWSNVSVHGYGAAPAFDVGGLVAAASLANQGYINGNATGLDVEFGATGSDTDINIRLAPKGIGQVKVCEQRSNRLWLAGANSGSHPLIQAIGASDANVNVSIVPKGTGGLRIGSSTPIQSALSATTTWDPPSLADGASATHQVTVTGAVVGNVVIASLTTIVADGWTVSATVIAADTVSVTITNKTGGVVDLGSGTLRAAVIKF